MKLRLRAERITKSESSQEIFLSVYPEPDPKFLGSVTVTGGITLVISNPISAPFEIGKEYVVEAETAERASGTTTEVAKPRNVAGDPTEAQLKASEARRTA